MPSALVMLVTEDLEIQQAVASALTPGGVTLVLASNAVEAMEILRNHPISLVFCSDELPGDGLDALIDQNESHENRVPIAVVSRFDDWKRYLDFLYRGAFDYVLYPLACGDVERVVSNVPSLIATGKVAHPIPVGPIRQRALVLAHLRHFRQLARERG
jgi:DNA-binding NtrC family response regulator